MDLYWPGMPAPLQELCYRESQSAMKKRALAALIVLAALAFGLLAGAHPCSAWQERNEAPAAAPSCHAGMKADPGASSRAGVPSREHSREHDSSKDCGTSCHHVCHMTAVATAEPVAFAIAPVALAVIEADGPWLALFVPPIDHIPLA